MVEALVGDPTVTMVLPLLSEPIYIALIVHPQRHPLERFFGPHPSINQHLVCRIIEVLSLVNEGTKI